MGSRLRWIFIAVSAVLFASVVVSVFDVRYYFFDEPVYVNAAQAAYERKEVENWEHPPLAKYFIMMGRLMSENKMAGARLPAVAAMLIFLIFLAGVAERLFAGKTAELFPTSMVFLLALTDPFLVNMSKVAMLEIYVVVFVTGGLFFTLRYLDLGLRRDLVGLGIFFGLAMACKWSAFPVFAVYFGAVALRARWAVMGYLAMAFVVYCLAFIPHFFLHGHNVTFADLVALHAQIFEYHLSFKFNFPHQSPAWSWPLLFKPIWLVVEDRGEMGMRGIFLVGNLITYYLGPLGLIWYAWKRPGEKSALLLGGYLSTLVFWLLAGRSTYYYYYLLCSPFIYLGALIGLWQIFKRRPQAAAALVVTLVAVFAIFYPVVRYWEISPTYAGRLLFIRSWLYPFDY